ncbi:MAG: SDR family oxidoreductase [Alphaproteobacteria bacterium]|nr:SDR family oxidoreductase [Alphaproteobacteria bacterium]
MQRRTMLTGLASLAAMPAQAAGGAVLVTGATGAIGKFVVEMLLARGEKARGLTRNPDKARAAQPKAEWVAGDLRDAASLKKAMVGVDRIIFTAGRKFRDEDPANTLEAVDYGGVVSLAAAAKEVGAKQFVLISSAGVEQKLPPWISPMLLEPIKWKAKSEGALKESGVPYTLIRPFGMDDRPGAQMGIVFLPSDPIMAQLLISRTDLAAVCVECLYQPKTLNTAFQLFNAATRTADDWKKALGNLG